MPQISSKFIAILIFVVTFSWIGSGFIPSLASKPEIKEKETEKVSPAPTVGITVSNAKQIWQEVLIHGTTESYRKVEIKSQIHGTIVSIQASEGGRVKQGDVIATLDVEDRKKNLESAKALVEQRQLEYNVAKSLKNSGHQSKTKLSESYANLKMAIATLSNAQTNYDDIYIKAPFDGIIQKLNVEQGDFLHKSGEQIATIIDDSKIIAVGQVPEKMISGIRIGNTAGIKTVSGIKAKGFVSYISKIADPITRTYQTEIEIVNDGYEFFEGMTTKISIPIKQIKAHLVKPSYFTLNEEGEIGLKTLSQDSKAEFYPIDIIKESTEGVWVTGIPNNSKIITLGQEFLKIGDKAQVAKN